MYSTQPDETYEHESSFSTQFNGMLIEDIQEFFSTCEEEIIEIFNLTTKHNQSIGIQYPMDLSQFITEGNLVTLTEMGECDYVGVVESLDTKESYTGSMVLSPDDEVLKIDLFYKYDKSEVTLPEHETVKREDVDCVYYEESIEILIEKHGATVMNADFDLDILCVVSDEYISKIVGDDTMRVALNI